MSVVSRWLLFLVALWIQSAGIVLVVKSFLGTSPISSLPYVMSETFPFTFGETTFTVNMVFLLGQMLILKKKFPKVQLLQAPMTMILRPSSTSACRLSETSRRTLTGKSSSFFSSVRPWFLWGWHFRASRTS